MNISLVQFSRCLSTSKICCKKVIPTNIKNKGVSSQLWLKRQLSDPYVEKAKLMNYRCRSAFKLVEINDKYKIFCPGQTVIDVGAAPGSWSQVAIKEVENQGKVISIDKQNIYPMEGVTILSGMDFTDPASQSRLMKELNGTKAQVVMSDMAPRASGIREMDNENMMNLCYSALRFSVQVSEFGATFLVKLWQCGQSKQLELDISRFYNNVKFVKPKASRDDSAEIFILGRSFKGLKKT
ncbi:rRNA methyltransferase 2, mitochondrial [Coccinella septempunctata]|uniref:rRNA methyltransferase 2, mitochondrial n=1 Tax=Coccinella septempunctata TaxID=41139 RepID=UPI001D0793E3|nr:rRNA methyltransferase 2, mitochondrial [Coccinella septempunctata]